ncbi:hypothetical protein ABT346_26850 [Micromonospora peucetia]|uniref:hypothetical protein n=1 Tax=Micromonospora peucetia TaxID=47871 RepID=UPI0033210655
MTTSPVKNSAQIGQATFADDRHLNSPDTLIPHFSSRFRMPWRFWDANGDLAGGEVRMALVNPPDMRLAADAA